MVVKNQAATGSAVISIVGFFAAADPASVPQSYVGASRQPGAQWELQRGETRVIPLPDAPASARSVLVQVGGASAASYAEARRVDCTTSAAACNATLVSLASPPDPITRSDVRGALLRNAAALAVSPPSEAQVDAVARSVLEQASSRVPPSAAATAPAAITLTGTPGVGSVTLTWKVTPGTQTVTGVRLTRDSTDQNGQGPWQGTETSLEGSRTLDMLTGGAKYTFSAAPIVDGAIGTAATLTVTAAAANGPATTPTPSAPAPAPALPAPPSGGSGAAMPVGNLPGWTQIIAQDFSTAAPLGTFAAKYRGYAAYDGSLDTSRGEGRPPAQVGRYDSATTSSVQNGVFTCRVYTKGTVPQVCALTPTPDGNWWPGQMYGRYSVRFNAAEVPGYKMAWLLWPSSDKWAEGEIDFPEGSLGGVIAGVSHDVNGTPAENAWFIDTGQRTNSWQTATIEWKPGSLTFILNDRAWSTTDPSALPRNPMRWALQTETELVAQAPPATAAGNVMIDWLTVYSYAPAGQ